MWLPSFQPVVNFEAGVERLLLLIGSVSLLAVVAGLSLTVAARTFFEDWAPIGRSQRRTAT